MFWINLSSHSMADSAFLASLRDTAHKIGIQVLAEGVETQAELDKLVELGLDGFTGPAVGGSGS